MEMLLGSYIEHVEYIPSTLLVAPWDQPGLAINVL